MTHSVHTSDVMKSTLLVLFLSLMRIRGTCISYCIFESLFGTCMNYVWYVLLCIQWCMRKKHPGLLFLIKNKFTNKDKKAIFPRYMAEFSFQPSRERGIERGIKCFHWGIKIQPPSNKINPAFLQHDVIIMSL